MTDWELAIVRFDGNGSEPYADLIVEALKKQIPKKVKFLNMYNYCPVCSWDLEDSDMFCPHCGQALKA